MYLQARSVDLARSHLHGKDGIYHQDFNGAMNHKPCDNICATILKQSRSFSQGPILPSCMSRKLCCEPGRNKVDVRFETAAVLHSLRTRDKAVETAVLNSLA